MPNSQWFARKWASRSRIHSQMGEKKSLETAGKYVHVPIILSDSNCVCCF